MTYTNIIDLTKAGTLRKHHTASTRGYISRKGDAVVAPYAGKYGKGYKVYTPRYDTTRYCHVTYYVAT